MQMNLRVTCLLSCVLVLRVAVAFAGGDAAGQSATRSAIPIYTDEETWDLLPPADVGGGAPLPIWARALAESLPRTTAAMLELDWQHRGASPLDPKLRGRIRWTVAHANQCDYAMVQASADLKRAGLNDLEIQSLEAAGAEPSSPEAAAIRFARNLTISADTITDEEVARIIDAFGEEKTVAMVLLVAYANFQDRLLLALQLRDDANAALPPLEVRF